ncbi:MAG: hypothetical protein Q7U97_15310 [Rhodocyclaceae bacterium]|nr:hypothetical protein [Rhodocyclaceae bacterium]
MMISANRLFLVLIGCLALPTLRAEDGHDAGLAAASEYRYGEALASFREVAAQGNRQAQLSAGGMLLYCERLYGKQIPCNNANRAEALGWLRLAEAQGSEAAGYLLLHAGR